MRIDVAMWDHTKGLSERHGAFRRENECLRAAGHDVALYWPSAGQEPRKQTDVIYYWGGEPIPETGLAWGGTDAYLRVARVWSLSDLAMWDGYEPDLMIAPSAEFKAELAARSDTPLVDFVPPCVSPFWGDVGPPLGSLVSRSAHRIVTFTEPKETFQMALEVLKGNDLVMDVIAQSPPDVETHMLLDKLGIDFDRLTWLFRPSTADLRRSYQSSVALMYTGQPRAWRARVAEALLAGCAIIGDRDTSEELQAGSMFVPWGANIPLALSRRRAPEGAVCTDNEKMLVGAFEVAAHTLQEVSA